MGGWDDYYQMLTQGPLFSPLFELYGRFMELERGNKFPFYIFPGVKNVGKKEETFLDFVDNLVDAHEIERNKHDANRDFYDRLVYVATNIHRHQNDTLANLMFDTKLAQPQYDRLNSAIAVRFTTYLVSMTALHTTGFAYLCYFFRYRRLTIVP